MIKPTLAEATLATATAKLAARPSEVEAWRELSVSCDADYSNANVGRLLEQLR